MTASELQSRRNTSKSGAGLVEVMIALFIFAASIAGMCSLALIARQSSDRSRDHYIAVNLAKNRLERAKSFGFQQLEMFKETSVLINSQGGVVASSSLPLDFRRTTTTTNITANLTEVRVTVEIRNRDSWGFKPGVEDMRSYVSNMSSGT